jgi:APA family basic amino acid/polyamine antiporter
LLKIFISRFPCGWPTTTGPAWTRPTGIVARQMATQSNPALVPGTQATSRKVTNLLAHPTAQLVAMRAHGLLNAPHFFGGEFGLNLPALIIAS